MKDESDESSDPAIDSPAFLRMPAVLRLTGLGRTTIYRLVAERRFPSPVRLGTRAIAWRKADIDRWSNDRPAIH